ncbi:MAG: tetratricopeptide repeat protein [Bacteroidales bacterium]|nr:tetratricopeptide repeat protein [Bacteroidales bacterium]
MKTLNIKYGIFVALIIVLASCSTKKNTGASRAYHNLTSHYNILFNGEEAFKKGMLTLQQSYKDNYTKLLPVFLYNDESQLSGISSDMDRAISKSTKLVSMHSITVKPELDDNEVLDAKERDFYNKNEYNKWVDEAYLLMGKGHFYKREFDKASQTFQYILSNYPDDETVHEARIWLARLAIEKKRTKEAEDIIATIEKDVNFPKKLKSELLITKAYMAIQAEDYQESISLLKETLELVRKKYFKQRYNYILAQLYQKIDHNQHASTYYNNVVKLNPPYEMTFNARINMALTYQSGSGSRKEIEKQLQKMLRDDKNIEYQDQVYYAWGNLYFKSGDKDKAVEYYKIAAAKGKNNPTQQAITYLTIADIFYESTNYVQAQSYYDSAVGVIDNGYPNYALIFAKSTNLTNLVEYIKTVELQDSVQGLAKMPTKDVYALIDNIIQTERKAEEEARIKEQEQRQQEAFFSQQQFELTSNKDDSWYFYNATSLNLGRQEFRRKWGNRKLEDNWRRRNKNSMSIEDVSLADESGDSLQGDSKTAKTSNKYSRDFYLANIPFTDSALAASHEKIKLALFEMGNIYANDLKDYDKAVDAYQELLKRYPGSENELQACYKLYSIGNEKQDINLVSKYKQKILNDYPNSNYAKVLGDPEYFKKVEQEEKKYKQTYENAYRYFDQGNLLQAASVSRKALVDYPEGELRANFEYLVTVAEGISKDTTQFIDDLQKLIAKYPQSDIIQNVNTLVSYLQNASPEAAREQKAMEAKELFSDNKEEEHYVVIAIQRNVSSNQLMFNIINFNIDNYSEQDLKVIKADVGNHSLLAVNPFADAKQAMVYYNNISTYTELWRDVNTQDAEIFVISTSNFEILKKSKSIENYLIYSEEHY